VEKEILILDTGKTSRHFGKEVCSDAVNSLQHLCMLHSCFSLRV